MKNIEELYIGYNKDIFNYLYSLVNDKSVAEDLLSETYLKVLIGYSHFRGESSEKTWIYSIARYTFYEYIREKNKKRNIEDEIYKNIIKLEVLDNKIENQYIFKELVKNINMILETLSKKEELVFRYRLKGYSYYEISQQLDISESSSRVLFFRTKEKIKAKLIEEVSYE